MPDECKPVADGRFRGVLNGDGCAGPIEHRLGRRLLRLIDPESSEGRALFESTNVEWLSPDGDSFGRLSHAEACRQLLERLDRSIERLSAAAPDLDACRKRLLDRSGAFRGDS